MVTEVPTAQRGARLGLVAVGLALVALDVRINGLDILPDVVGWAIAAVALSALPRTHFGAAAVTAGIAGLLSLADLKMPVATVTEVGGSDPSITGVDGIVTTETTQVTQPATLTGTHAALAIAYAVAMVIATVVLCRAVRNAANAAGDGPTSARFGLLAGVLGATGVLGALGVVVANRSTTAPVALALVVILVGLAADIWLMVSLVQVRHRDYLRPGPPTAVA